MGPSLVALLVSLASAAAPPPAAPAPDRAHLDALLGRARAERVWEDVGWLRLGHWRATADGRWKSEVDGMAFFRAISGKTSPRAELEATLRGLFDARPVADELEDAQCRFPARFAWLVGRLGIDLSRLPPRRCPRLEEFLDRVRPRAATLVFSSYYLNNPASAFGHTFLRLDKGEGGERAGRERELLDYGVDYSATVTTQNAVLYALAGLLGFFEGHFNHYAYYYKVREYADAESRDLWEYDLALTPGEVAMLTAHLWELGGTYFSYWYLDENCSYHVLGALEAAAPRLSLLEHVGKAVVLPSDTVKALFRNPGLVRSVHYRPSIRTQFEARAARLDRRGLAALDRVARDPAAPLPALAPGEQAAVLDAALDRVDLRFGRQLVVGKAPAAARDRQVLLERRSTLGVVSPPLEIAPPRERAPELGHGSFRLGAGGGASTLDGGLVLLDLRLALHDLGDPPAGYPPLSQIEFLPLRVRLAPREGRVELDEAWAVRVLSLNDLSRFDLRPSWRVKFGAATVRDAGCRACLAGAAELGTGLTKSLGPLDVYAGGDAMIEGSPRLSGSAGSGWRLGAGPGGIARLRLGGVAALLADARWRWLADAQPGKTWDLRGTLRVHVASGASLSLEARRTPAEDVLSASVLGYF